MIEVSNQKQLEILSCSDSTYYVVFNKNKRVYILTEGYGVAPSYSVSLDLIENLKSDSDLDVGDIIDLLDVLLNTSTEM